MILPQPVEVWHPICIFCYAIGEVGGLFAQVVFCGGEDALLLITGMLGDDQAKTGCGDDADRTSAAIEEIGRAPLTQVSYDQDRAGGTFGQLCQWSQDLSDILIAGLVN